VAPALNWLVWVCSCEFCNPAVFAAAASAASAVFWACVVFVAAVA
jgi:hypothetical protein